MGHPRPDPASTEKGAVREAAAAMLGMGGEVWVADETTLREFPPRPPQRDGTLVPEGYRCRGGRGCCGRDGREMAAPLAAGCAIGATWLMRQGVLLVEHRRHRQR